MIKIAMEEVIIEWRFHMCVYIYSMKESSSRKEKRKIKSHLK